MKSFDHVSLPSLVFMNSDDDDDIWYNKVDYAFWMMIQWSPPHKLIIFLFTVYVYCGWWRTRSIKYLLLGNKASTPPTPTPKKLSGYQMFKGHHSIRRSEAHSDHLTSVNWCNHHVRRDWGGDLQRFPNSVYKRILLTRWSNSDPQVSRSVSGCNMSIWPSYLHIW